MFGLWRRQKSDPRLEGMEDVMVRLIGVTKSFRAGRQRKMIADNATFDFPRGQSVALMGRNGAGKSTLLRMIAGNVQPDRGEILVNGTVSWPVGYTGSFHPDLSGAQNTRFIARAYGVDTDEMLDFVQDFAEIGAHFHQPIRTYSSGMRARLSFGVSMAIDFDIYLVDEVTATGDRAFRTKSTALFNDRMKNSSAIFVSHSEGELRRVCQSAVVVEGGHLTYYPDIEEGIEKHLENMAKRPPQI